MQKRSWLISLGVVNSLVLSGGVVLSCSKASKVTKPKRKDFVAPKRKTMTQKPELPEKKPTLQPKPKQKGTETDPRVKPKPHSEKEVSKPKTKSLEVTKLDAYEAKYGYRPHKALEAYPDLKKLKNYLWNTLCNSDTLREFLKDKNHFEGYSDQKGVFHKYQPESVDWQYFDKYYIVGKKELYNKDKYPQWEGTSSNFFVFDWSGKNQIANYHEIYDYLHDREIKNNYYAPKSKAKEWLEKSEHLEPGPTKWIWNDPMRREPIWDYIKPFNELVKIYGRYFLKNQ